MTDRAWSLHDEFKYLQNIGKHYGGTQAIPVSEMLKRYIEGSKLRMDWGGMQRSEAFGFAMRLLREAVEQERAVHTP